MSREVLKVFCPRNHRIGTMIADTEGYAVEYTANVVHIDSVFPSSQKVTDRLSREEVASLAAYCRSCNRPVTLSVRALLRAADGGKRDHHAQAWGGEARGENRLKHDPRRIEQ